MQSLSRAILNLLVCLSLIFSGIPLSRNAAHAESNSNSNHVTPNKNFEATENNLFDPKENWAAFMSEKPSDKELINRIQLHHWTRLQLDDPALAEFALGKPLVNDNQPLWKMDERNPILDEDPFFLRSQEWVELPKEESENCRGVCTSKTENGYLQIFDGTSNALEIHQKFTPVLETDSWVFFSADDDELFNEKTGSTGDAQGLFFINKSDLLFYASKKEPMPIFYLPLPGAGWLTPEVRALEVPVYDTIAVRASDGFILDIEKKDVRDMEILSRKNYTLLKVVTLVQKGFDENGFALPAPNSTMSFGLIASLAGNKNVAALEDSSLDRNSNISKTVTDFIFPKAYASGDNSDDKKTTEEMIAQAVDAIVDNENPETAEATEPKKSFLKKWLTPTVLYGGTGALAYSAASDIDWSKLITDDMPQRLLTIASIFGVVAVSSLALRYSIHRDHFNKRYPITERDSLLRKLNQEHKAFLDEFVHGLRFSAGALTQGILRSIDYMKDRVFPRNKMIDDSWKATLGFYIRASQRLPIDYKCFYLGAIVFGMSDSLMVAVDLLIFTPWLLAQPAVQNAMDAMGAGDIDPVILAAYASSMVLGNFIASLQHGAIGYSAEVRMINMDRAQKEAERVLTSQGIDPENPRNMTKLNKIREATLAQVSKSVGLPGPDAFLYDAITIMEKSLATSGYSIHGDDNPEQKEAARESGDFVLKNRHWGLIQPALKSAIRHAEQVQAQTNSPAGAKIIELLRWASRSKDNVSVHTASNLLNFKADSPKGYWANYWKAIKEGDGRWRAFSKGMAAATQRSRDIRMVLYLMSTTESYKNVMGLLPKSWIEQAGSDEVAQAAAEIFHREFMALYTKKTYSANPTPEMVSKYAIRAEQIVEDANDPMTSDPFVKIMRVKEAIVNLYDQDQARINFLTYKPKDLSSLERKQWAKASAAVNKNWDETSSYLISKKWQSLAATYADRHHSNDSDFDAQEWIRSNYLNLQLATELAKQFGLGVSDFENSELVRNVVLKASEQTESELAVITNDNYRQSLPDEEARNFHRARIFYTHFVSNLFEQTLLDEKFDAYSPEFPGRFQSLRAKLASKKWARPLVNLLKVSEIAFRVDAASYSPGRISQLNRSVPMVPDFYHNFVRGARGFPYIFTVGYLINYYIWQIHIPYPLLVFGAVFSFTNPSFVEMNNRLMRSFNIKPMDDAPSKLTYSWIHSRLTNPQVMLEMMFATTIVGALSFQNLSLGAATAGGLLTAKYYHSVWKKKRENSKKLESVKEIAPGQIELRNPIATSAPVVATPELSIAAEGQTVESKKHVVPDSTINAASTSNSCMEYLIAN